MQAYLDGDSSPSRLFGALWGRAVACVLLVAPLSSLAQDKLPLLTGPELGLPSLWRVLLGFVLVAAIAFGVVALMRKNKRWLPLPIIARDEDIMMVSRRQLTRNLDIHVIKVNGQRFMIVSSPHQLAVTELAASYVRDSTNETK